MEEVKQDANIEDSSASNDANSDSSPEEVNVEGVEGKELAEDDNSDSSTEANVPFHKHPRFQELNNKVKELTAKLQEYENAPQTETTQEETQGTKTDFVKETVDDLVQMGFGEDVAQKLALRMLKMVDNTIAPIRSQMTSGAIETTISKFKETHPDFTPEIEKAMEKEYGSYPADLKQAIAKAGAKGLEVLYKTVKSDLKPEVEPVKKTGSVAGKSASLSGKMGKKITKDNIDSLSQEDYDKHADEVWALLKE